MDESTAGVFRGVFTTLVDRLPGEPAGADAGHEGTVRHFMVKEPAVMPAAAGVATRMRDRPARAAATLGLP